MNSSVQDAPSIPGLVLLAESGRDSRARRYRVQAERPVTLYWFQDSKDAKSIENAAHSFAEVAPPGFAPVLKAFVHDGRAGVLLGCERAEDAFDGPIVGEDAILFAIRPVVSGLLALEDAKISHGRLRRCLIAQHDGSVVGLPAFCVAPEPSDERSSATQRDVLAILELVVHGVCGSSLGEGLQLPAGFHERASPRLVATLSKLLAAVKSGSNGLAELRASYLAPRDGTTRNTRAVVQTEADRSQRRLVFTALAVASPIVVLFLMGLGGGLERARNFLRMDDSAPEPTPYTPKYTESGTPQVSSPAGSTSGSTPPAIDDSAAAKALAEKIISDIRASAKPAPTPKARDPELVAAEELEAEGKKLLQDVRDKKVDLANRNAVLQQAIDKLEAARTKLDTLIEQKPELTRQLEGSLEDLNALIFGAYRLKTRD